MMIYTTSPSHGGLFHPNLAINTWLILIENMSPSCDKKVHTAEIECESNPEIGKRVFKTVERQVFPMVKLMEVKDTRLLDDIKNVQEAVDVENYEQGINYRAHHELENDVGVAADDGLNWFFDIHNNETDAEGTAALALL